MNEDMYFFNEDDGLSLEERLKLAVKAVAFNMLAIFLILTICALIGCKGEEIVTVETVEKVRIDTLREYHTTHDSIHVRDSVSVVVKGDTVFKDRWHTEWRDRWRHDTVYVARTDSIPKPYPVTVEVEKELSWWQQTQIYGFRIAVAIAVLLLLWKRRKSVWSLIKTLCVRT